MSTKMFTRWVAPLLLAVLAMSAGCSQPQEISLTEADNGKQIEMTQGQVLIITLESNITTGYEWDIAEMDDQILILQGEPEYQAPDTDLVGAGGKEVYRFECVDEGQTTLQLIYHRPFETEEPVETFTLEITAR